MNHETYLIDLLLRSGAELVEFDFSQLRKGVKLEKATPFLFICDDLLASRPLFEAGATSVRSIVIFIIVIIIIAIHVIIIIVIIAIAVPVIVRNILVVDTVGLLTALRYEGQF